MTGWNWRLGDWRTMKLEGEGRRKVARLIFHTKSLHTITSQNYNCDKVKIIYCYVSLIFLLRMRSNGVAKASSDFDSMFWLFIFFKSHQSPTLSISKCLNLKRDRQFREFISCPVLIGISRLNFGLESVSDWQGNYQDKLEHPTCQQHMTYYQDYFIKIILSVLYVICTTMLIFGLFGIFFFPKINAQDEMKIDQNKNIHWKRHCEKVTNDAKGYSCLKAKNTEMKYIIDSPDTSAIGKLVKETKIEGCQNIGGCNLILKLGMVSK